MYPVIALHVSCLRGEEAIASSAKSIMDLPPTGLPGSGTYTPFFQVSVPCRTTNAIFPPGSVPRCSHVGQSLTSADQFDLLLISERKCEMSSATVIYGLPYSSTHSTQTSPIERLPDLLLNCSRVETKIDLSHPDFRAWKGWSSPLGTSSKTESQWSCFQ